MRPCFLMRRKEINYNLRSILGAREFHARFLAVRDFGLRPKIGRPPADTEASSRTWEENLWYQGYLRSGSLIVSLLCGCVSPDRVCSFVSWWPPADRSFSLPYTAATIIHDNNHSQILKSWKWNLLVQLINTSGWVCRNWWWYKPYFLLLHVL